LHNATRHSPIIIIPKTTTPEFINNLNSLK
jgi:hypothetical protein